jgi:hypothetical protein
MKRWPVEILAGVLASAVVACASPETPSTTGAGGADGAAGSSALTGAAGDNATTGAAGTPSPSGAAGSGAGGAVTTGAAGAGAGGAMGASTCAPIPAADLVSDFETGTAVVAMVSGRAGSWFVDNDGTGTQTPAKIAGTALPAEAGGACNSAYSLRTSGMGFTVWGAEIGTDLAPHKGTMKVAYDASMYSGIALRAKAATAQLVRVSLSDDNTSTDGSVCVNTTVSTNPKRCGDYFGTDLMLTSAWQDYPMPFAQMKQRGFGLPIAAGIDKTRLYTLRIEVSGSAAAPATFDFSIDDVRFIK